VLKKQSNRYRQIDVVGRISSSITPSKVGNFLFLYIQTSRDCISQELLRDYCFLIQLLSMTFLLILVPSNKQDNVSGGIVAYTIIGQLTINCA